MSLTTSDRPGPGSPGGATSRRRRAAAGAPRRSPAHRAGDPTGHGPLPLGPATSTTTAGDWPGAGAGSMARGARTRLVTLVLVVAVLNVFGLVMVLSASSVVAAAGGSSWSFFNRQLLWMALGIVAAGIGAVVPYERWRAAAPYLYAVAIGLLLVVAVPRFGTTVDGSRRWLQIGPQRFQPSELAKLALIVSTAALLARRSHRIADPRRSLRPVLVATVPVVALVMVQPDLGTSLIIVAVVGSVLVAAGVPAGPLLRVGVGTSTLAAAAAMAAPYRRARVMGFLDPWSDPHNTTYQTLQSLVGLAEGGWTGVGLGGSRAKWGFLPNAHTDFIYAVIGEELGLIGALVVLGAFVLVGVCGYGVALACEDRFGSLLAAGVTTWLLVQAFVNMGGVIALMPITGVTLPFVSFGGTALLANMAAVGILVNIAGRPLRERSMRTAQAATRGAASQALR